jgi:hypothetical protein
VNIMAIQAEAAEWIRKLALATGAFSVEAPARAGAGAFDCVMTVTPRPSRKSLQLFVVANERVTPQLALGLLHRATAHRPHGVPVLCAKAISPRVAELCRAHDVGYLDASGNCRIAAPGLFIHIEGKRNLYPDTRAASDPFAPKSSRIVRLLLSDPKRGWQVQELAKEAEISLGLASRIKQKLIEQAHVTLRDRRMFIREPRELLAAWGNAFQPPLQQFSFYVMDERPAIERRAAEWCASQGLRYALTAFSGAWRVAPTVRYNVATLYVDFVSQTEQLSALQKAVSAKRVDDGANLSLWVPSDRFVFHESRSMDGLQTVSPIQLYLDLLTSPGRSIEAASEILEREILPKW